MDFERELQPVRNLVYGFALFALCAVAILVTPARESPQMHTFFDAGMVVVSGVLALLLWDLGWRTDDPLTRLLAVAIGVTAAFELFHILTALEFSRDAVDAARLPRLLRPVTWPPTSHVLPIGLVAAYALRNRGPKALPLLVVGLTVFGVGMLFFFDSIPPYTAPTWFGITRPSLVLVPFLCLFVGIFYWRVRASERLGRIIALFSILAVVGNVAMLFSQAPADAAAMVAHAARLADGLFLLFTLTQMGTIDTAQRMTAERELKASNEALESRVVERTAALEAANTELRTEAHTRQVAERRALVQLERLALLERITRAIAERQDLESIFQVVVRSVEEHLPADFAALCNYTHHARVLTVSRVGARSGPLALELAMTEQSRIEIDQNGLSRCVTGKLVYEPDIAKVRFPFPQRLARGGLGSMVVVPLMVEQRSGVFGVLVVARHAAHAFSSAECEFLRQLCDHVSLAANQAQLHDSLKQAYDDLQVSQGAVMQQERLRALGQMASGIAHDINNAISPVSLYVEALLTHETGFSTRARGQLEIIQRAVDDVAHTVARMGEFYRQGKGYGQMELAPVAVTQAFREVLELTKARWSDMAQQRGTVIETKVECEGESPVVMALASELREALINLVLNATDAMPEGGTLTLRTGHSLQAGKGVSRRVYIEVSDTGAGMDEATRRRCLEPFFTTKGDRGSGLGLAMVYGIAQRHGADIDIISAPGEGTTFRMTFSPTSPAAQSTGSLRIQKIPRHTKILLIDDDPVLLTSLREVLVHDGHQVQTASGGRVGIDAFRDALKAGKPFPVVITDLGMPHVDGRAVAAAIKAAAPDTSIIMLTGWGQRLVASGETPADVFAVVSKPPRIAELRQVIAECTGQPDA